MLLSSVIGTWFHWERFKLFLRASIFLLCHMIVNSCSSFLTSQSRKHRRTMSNIEWKTSSIDLSHTNQQQVTFLTFSTSVQLEPHSNMWLPSLYLNSDATSNDWFIENVSFWENLLCIALEDLRLNHKDATATATATGLINVEGKCLSRYTKFLPTGEWSKVYSLVYVVSCKDCGLKVVAFSVTGLWHIQKKTALHIL